MSSQAEKRAHTKDAAATGLVGYESGQNSFFDAMPDLEALEARLRHSSNSLQERDVDQLELDLDIFEGERLDETWRPREDLQSLELPLFSLQKGKDIRTREYRNGGQVVRIIPSIIGAANIFDNDLLVYAATLIRKAEDAEIPTSRRVRFKVRDFLRYTRRSMGGASYVRIVGSCRRLKGTIIETNFDLEFRDEEGEAAELATGNSCVRSIDDRDQLRGYGLIENYSVVTYTNAKDGALEIELVLSTWTYRALVAKRVLSIDPDFFSLSQGIERRLYNLAKKHTGEKLWWKIGLEKLHVKSGSAQALKYFRREIVAAIAADNLPEFHIALDEKKGMVVFFRRDKRDRNKDLRIAKEIHRELLAKKLTTWYYSLRRWDSKAEVGIAAHQDPLPA